MTNEKLQELTLSINESTSDDIVSVGYGFKTVNGKLTNEKSLVYMVSEKKDINEIPVDERIPSEINHEGEILKTDVVEGIVKPQGYGMCDASFYTWQSNPPTNQDVHRPLMGGVSVTNFGKLPNYVGTLGFIAVDNETNHLVGVSNNHVLIDDAWITQERNLSGVHTNVHQDPVTQPNEQGNSGINFKMGTVIRYQPLSSPTNFIDCAITNIDEGMIDPSISWRQHNINGMTSAPRFATTPEINQFLSEDHREYFSAGRTTGGKGEGVIKLLREQSAASITISYNKQGQSTTTKMNDTFVLMASGNTTPTGDTCYFPSNGGDSGSAILTKNEETNEYLIVGLLYGGTYVNDGDNQYPVRSLCNRIDRIEQKMNIRFWDGTMNGIVPYIGGDMLYVVEGASQVESIVINGRTYWQLGLGNPNQYPATNA